MSRRPRTQRAAPEFCGVIHLGALPGSFRSIRLARSGKTSVRTQLELIVRQAVVEARVLEDNGFDSIIIENFGDSPFRKDEVSSETVASMALVAQAVRAAVKLPIGVNVLRNDASSALAIAAVVGCQFVRVNVLSGVAATDQGWIEGRAHEVLTLRERLDPSVRILGDVWVKHARQFSSVSLSQSIEEAIFRAGADAVIVTGSTTGRLAARETLEEALDVCRSENIALYLGSGVSAETLRELPVHGIAGLIVGSDLRQSGRAGARIDPRRTANWVKAARSHFRS